MSLVLKEVKCKQFLLISMSLEDSKAILVIVPKNTLKMGGHRKVKFLPKENIEKWRESIQLVNKKNEMLKL